MRGVTYEGKPCRHGHGTTRYLKSRGCVECARGYYDPRRVKPKKPKPQNTGQLLRKVEPCKQLQAFTVRIPADLYLVMHGRAQKEYRTLNAQVMVDLETLYGLRT